MSKLLKNSVLVSVLSLGGAFLNFLAQMIIAGYFGTSVDRDAFFAASVIPAYINTIVAGSLGVVFLPKLIDARINKRSSERDLINGVTGFSLLFLSLLGIGLALFSDALVSLLFPGLSYDAHVTTGQLLILLCPALVFQSYTTILSCIYHAENKFLVSASAHLLTPLINIASVVLAYKHLGINSLAIGTSLGYTVALVFVQANCPVRYRLKPFVFRHNNDVAACLRESLPWLLGGFIYRANTVVERMVASRFPGGVISYLGYAGGLITTLSLITMNGIATTIFPRLSEAWAARDYGTLRELFGMSMKFTFALCLPIIVLIIAYNGEIVQVLFERGAFTSFDTMQVGSLLAIGTGAFLFICMNTVPGKLLYATGTSRLAIAGGTIEVAIYTAAAFALSNAFSYSGIIYAQILSTMCSTIFSAAILQVRFRIFNGQGIGSDMARILGCAVISYLVMISYRLWLDKPGVFTAAVLGATGVIVYFILLVNFISEGRRIRQLILSKVQQIRSRK